MKIFKVLLALSIMAMLVMAFAACTGNDNGGGAAPPPPPPAPTEAPPPPPPPAPPAGNDPAPVEPDVVDEGFVMPTTPITLTFFWWGADGRNAAVQEAVDIFMDRYPNITIETHPTTGAFADIADAMQIRVAAGEEADINQVNFNWAQAWGRGNNIFADLRQFDHIIDFSQFAPGDIAQMTFPNGEISGLPHGMNARMLVTNTAFLNEFGLDTMPTDFEEFIALAELISANNAVHDTGSNRYVTVPFSNLDIDHYILTMFYSLTGRNPVVNAQWQYSVDEVYTVLDMLMRLDAAGGQPSFENFDVVGNRNNQVWTSGRGLSSMQWINMPQLDAQVVLEGAVEGDMVLFPFPQPGGNVVTSARASLAHAISRNANHPEVAAYFLNWFYTDPDAVRAVGIELGVPGAIDAFAIITPELHPLQAQGVELLSQIPVGEMGIYWELATLRNPRYAIYDELRTGNITVREAAERMVREQQDAIDAFHR
jgi:oligogalacturonide transport system substrate-binding protein